MHRAMADAGGRKGVSILMTIRNLHIPIVTTKPIPVMAIVEQYQNFFGVFAIAF